MHAAQPDELEALWLAIRHAVQEFLLRQQKAAAYFSRPSATVDFSLNTLAWPDDGGVPLVRSLRTRTFEALCRSGRVSVAKFLVFERHKIAAVHGNHGSPAHELRCKMS